MVNIIGGIIVIAICVAGFFYAWNCYKKEEYSKCLFLIIFCGLLLRIYVGTDFFLHEWDERFHALVAKNLIKHPLKPTLYDEPLFPYEYTEWSGNHIWLAKPPLPLWFMASSIYLFGNNEIAIRIPSFLLSTSAIYLTFLIGSFLFNRRIGLLAAFLHSIHGSLIELAGGRNSSDHVETCFIFFVQLSILCSIIATKKNSSKRTALIGVFMGAAFLSKWTPSLIVVPIWLLLIFKSEHFSTKNLLHKGTIFLLFFLIVAFPWHYYAWKHFPIEANLMFQSFYKPLSNIIQEHSGPPWFYLKYMRINFGEIVYLPLIWCVWKMIKGKINYRLLLVFLWIAIPITIFSIAETKRQTYMFICAPGFFLLTAYFFNYCYQIRTTFKYKWAIVTVMVLLIGLPIRYSLERIKPFEKNDRTRVWAQNYRKLNSLIKEKKVVLFNIERPIEAMFYTDFIAYPFIPNSEQINEMIRKGYKVVINDNGKLDVSIKGLKEIVIISI